MFSRPIAISLSPNTQKDDVFLALKLVLSPIQWFNFRYTEKLENEFAKYFGKGYCAVAVNSGRSALYLILKVLGIKEDDEVAIQALTCVAVPNSILWLKAKPLFVDIDETLNMDPLDLSEKLSEKTKAIIVQHSFGNPAQIDKITKIARKRKIPVIEDCALALGAKFKGKLVGTIGDVSFFSFGRDKVISSVFGGIILTKDKSFYEKLVDERDELGYPGPFWVFQQLMHPILFSLILPTYNLGLGKLTVGKILLFGAQTLGILSKAVYWQEKQGLRPDVFPAKLPGALSLLALNQLGKLNIFNKKRLEIAKIYFKNFRNTKLEVPIDKKGAIWVRFPVITERAKDIFRYAQRKGILLGDWYKDVIVPVRSLSYFFYKSGSCPKAERIAGKILNLPTYPSLTKKEAQKVVQLIKDFEK